MRGVLEGERSGSASLGMWGRWGICNQGTATPEVREVSSARGRNPGGGSVCVGCGGKCRYCPAWQGGGWGLLEMTTHGDR